MPKVKTLRWHTAHGVEHSIGDEYDAPDDVVPTLLTLGWAERVATDEPAPAPSQPVQPLGLEQPE